MHKAHFLHIKSHEENGTFCGYASVFEVTDHHNEQVSKNAFSKSLQNWKKKGQMPKLLWQHDTKQPIGLWHTIEEDKHGLYVKGQLLLDVQQGHEAYTLLKYGILDGLSIGFKVVRSHRDEKKHFRILDEVDLFEISLVTFAANPAATITELKSHDWEFKRLCQRLDYLGHLLNGHH